MNTKTRNLIILLSAPLLMIFFINCDANFKGQSDNFSSESSVNDNNNNGSSNENNEPNNPVDPVNPPVDPPIDPPVDPPVNPPVDPPPASNTVINCQPLGGVLAWQSGFENGFPGGEWLNFDNGSWSPSGNMPPGRVSAWTIVDQNSGEPVHSGNHSYKAWITGASNELHRAYPVIHGNYPTPLVNSFWVYQEADYASLQTNQWVALGTWGNNPDWAVHTMAFRDRRVEMAHLSPFGGVYVGPQPQPDFPLGQWVRFTAYIHYQGNVGTIHVWQDGVHIYEGTYTNRSGTELMRAHWGLYADPGVASAAQYNDDISIWTLTNPITNFNQEPCAQ